ncbi:MAG: Hydrogenase nickel incorporation protein HypB [Anaerolinea thermophila]|jgi:hydrogenase nickel incorporation protein HypB|uniref:Hydrogenase nickel incorporation protein HypB n=1 Tax=Anaerolinea thermophila TaxID=167964 RepID=A0A101FWZ8_9CHLR|nr:MAG: Hydrogenase nickel incorporation protein HypB [Anaerolinea thermophila]
MTEKRIKIVENILNANDQIALKNRQRINEAGAYSINLMASPGAGKTSFILATIKSLLNEEIQIGVIEGDTAPVTIDSDKISAAGMPAVQVNTGGQCHLDAVMIENALDQLPLDSLDLLIVENVGNLICPAAFKLGTHSNVLIASVPEGDDKPYKYPNIYRGLDVLIINKIDLLPYLDFDMDYFRKGVKMLNPGLQTFAVSCKTNQGIEDWLSWLRLRISKK